MRKLITLLALLPAFAFADGDGISSPANFASPPVLGSATPNAVFGTSFNASNGTASAPAYSFSSAIETGIYWDGATLNIEVSGARIYGFSAGSSFSTNPFVVQPNLPSAVALVVGQGGQVNPAFQVDEFAASQATGIKVTGKAAGAGTSLSAISSGVNENLTIDAKGTGNLLLQTVGAGNVQIGTGFGYTNILMSATAPTISSGFGTGATPISNNGTATFRINVGTGGVASFGVIGLTAATTGWNCQVSEFNPNASALLSTTVVTASTTTSVTVQNDLLSTGAATAWQASQVLIANCMAY